ncbi:MAG: radical SAM protein [Desulfobacteraceae bacterium]|nr:radical SAM protein [Desulfobacteraceae bacterium]
MTEPKDLVFEQGPIRPPSEAGSLLIRFTRNCPWNKCSFCPVYKKREFSRRSLEEIKADIDTVALIVEDLRNLSVESGYDGRIVRDVLNRVFTSSRYNGHCRHVAYWLYNGRGSVFIQDANSLLLPSETLVEALLYLREKVPGIGRITSYARSSTLAKKTVAELSQIRRAGLDRIHIGMESGSDRVLAFIRKGVSAEKQIEAGRRVVEAGMELSEYFMPGLGGRDLSEDHARESARVLNAINPHFIRLRTLRVPPRAPLYQDVQAGRFTKLSDDETVGEIRLFIAGLEGISSRVVSDHIMNLLEEVEGVLPEGKEKMLCVIDRYLGLPPEEKLLFRLGRRGGGMRTLDELNDPVTRQRLQTAMHDLTAQTGGDIERVITELADQYI